MNEGMSTIEKQPTTAASAQEFRSCVNGEHGYAGKGFVYGFGGDARFRAPVALFNDFNSNDGR